MSRPPSDPAEALSRIRDDEARVGLCALCSHTQAVVSPRSVFVRCALAATDPRFPRYPVLPVLECDGFLDRR